MTKGRALAVLWLALAASPAGARELAPASADAIVAALEQAQPGDIVTIAPGRYELPGMKLHQDGPITVRAGHAGEVELRSTATEFIKVAGADWTFENLDIAGICTDDSRCEHAFHIVEGADRTIIRNNRIRDYNAHIKGNGENGRFPNSVLIEGNMLFGTHPRRTDNPIAPIDVVGGKGWIVRGNLIADYGKTFDHPASRTDDYGYALFFKGNSSATAIERNVVLCADRLPHLPYTRGLSLGGSATGPQYCEGSCDNDENRDSVMRDNAVLACPGQPGIYLFRAARAQVTGNTLIGTGGIVAVAPDTSARVVDNVIAGGGLSSSADAHLDLGHSVHIEAKFAATAPDFAAKAIAAYRAYAASLKR